MIREKSVSVEKIRAAERVDQGLFLGIDDFEFVIAPSFDGLDPAAHLSPLRRHPLLVFFPNIELEQTIQHWIGGVGRDSGEDLRRGGGAPIEFPRWRFNRGNCSNGQHGPCHQPTEAHPEDSRSKIFSLKFII